MLEVCKISKELVIKISYSQCNIFKQCPTFWHNRYRKKYEPIETGASLFFGSAVDDAIMALLDGKKDYMNVFYTMWENSTNMFGKVTPVFDNLNVVYSHADFDKYLMEKKDLQKLSEWLSELKLEVGKVKATDENGASTTRLEAPDEVFARIAKKKKNPYKKLTKAEKRYFARASWLSLRKKGEILIEAFKEQFYPRITKVHGTQIRAEVKSDDGQDSIGGLLDFVLEIEGNSVPIIFDLKTAASPYKQESIDRTEQLALYYALKGKEYNTNLVGYVVLCKNIPKEKEAYCKECGNKKTGRHKTCDFILEDSTRCNGEWKETIKLVPEVQVLVQEKGQSDVDSLYQDYSNILFAMKKDIIFKNVDKCNNFYGNKCPFFDLCWNGDDSNLIKKGKRSK